MKLIPKHVFFPGRLTAAKLLLYQNFILGTFERDLQVDAVCSDFRKVFDRVDHVLLIRKT